MPLLDQIRTAKLIQLARKSFDPNLSDAELKVLRDSASSLDPVEPAADAPRPPVRSDFVRWLATDPETALNIDPKGLRLYGMTLPSTLDLQECRITIPLYFFLCTIEGEINLQSAETRGIYLLGCSIEGELSADGINIHGPLFLSGTSFSSEIRLRRAKIKSDLDCKDTKLRATTVDALLADGAEIRGTVFLNGEFESFGTIRLLGAKINGDLDCQDAKLRVTGGKALSADRAEIGGAVFLSGEFESSGIIHLQGAKIKGNLVCTDAKLRVTGENALSADRVEIGGTIGLCGGFESSGIIRLPSAKISGDLDFCGAKVDEVRCPNLHLSGDLLWMGIEKSEKIYLDLNGAMVKNLRDDRESWPSFKKLAIDGLVYEELTLHERLTRSDIEQSTYGKELPLNARERIEWLKLQRPDAIIEPQPWMQLAKLLEAKGDGRGAKLVLCKFRCLQARKREWHPWKWLRGVFSKIRRGIAILRKPWNREHPVYLYLRHPNRIWHIAFAGLEEDPFRICYSITLMLVLGTTIFAGAIRNGAMIETVRLLPNAYAPNWQISKSYPSFQPFVYTLENAVPLIKLGMDDKWTPNPQHTPQPWFPKVRWLNWLTFFNNYWFLAISRWALIVSGWAQATILAAALSSRFKQ